MRPLPRPVRLALLAGLLVFGSLLGSAIALRAGGVTSERTAFGVVEAQTTVARHGRVDAYVPLLDWGVRLDPYRAPVEVQLRLVSVDRSRLVRSLRSASEAEEGMVMVRRDLERVVRAQVERAFVLTLVGGCVGGVLTAALYVAVWRRPRRLLLGGALGGLLVSAAAAGLSVWSITAFDAQSLREPTFYARGHELPRVLAFAAQIEETTESYTDSYEQALTGLTKLLAVSAGAVGEEAQGYETMTLMSDLHANTLVLPALAEYVGEGPLFFVGDFSQLGTSYEEAVVPALARLDAPVYAVSGNHDSSPFMRRLAGEGITVLTRAGVLRPDGRVVGPSVIEVSGLKVAGYDDPLESEDALEDHDLELKGEELKEAQADLVDWFRSLPERPDVVLVHQRGLGKALLDEGDSPLLVLAGHTHKQALEQRGQAVLVDGGTVGAGGPFGIGVQPAGFALLRFSGDLKTLKAVDLIEAEPLSGDASAKHVVIRSPEATAQRRRGLAALLGERHKKRP